MVDVAITMSASLQTVRVNIGEFLDRLLGLRIVNKRGLVGEVFLNHRDKFLFEAVDAGAEEVNLLPSGQVGVERVHKFFGGVFLHASSFRARLDKVVEDVWNIHQFESLEGPLGDKGIQAQHLGSEFHQTGKGLDILEVVLLVGLGGGQLGQKRFALVNHH